MTEKLKPCPFCGNWAEIYKDDEDYYHAYCPKCGAETDCYGSPETAIEFWNNRPIEDARAEEIKRIREALELIAKEKFYFARGEEEKQIRRVCEIAEEALKGKL